MLTGKVVTAPNGIRGVDVNTPISSSAAAALVQHGYDFVFRYVRRHQSNSYDLSVQEAGTILSAGLGLGVVQHVESADAWVPSATKGVAYGNTAGQEGHRVGLPVGTQIWCDLEGVADGVSHASVIQYGKWWYDGVKNAGFTPCLYVGWHSGLTAEELYHALPFAHYWSAYNLNADEVPVVRGVCLTQHAAKPTDYPPGVALDMDVDVTQADAKGGQITVVAPDGWLDSLTG